MQAAHARIPSVSALSAQRSALLPLCMTDVFVGRMQGWVGPPSPRNVRAAPSLTSLCAFLRDRQQHHYHHSRARRRTPPSFRPHPLRLAVRARSLQCRVSLEYPCEAAATDRDEPAPALTYCLQSKPFHIYPPPPANLSHSLSLCSYTPTTFHLLSAHLYQAATAATLQRPASAREPTVSSALPSKRTTAPYHTNRTKNATARRAHVASAPTGCMTAPRICPASS